MSQSDTSATDDPVTIFGGHRQDGLYVYGPRSVYCILALLIDSSALLVVTASSPDAERKQRVTYKGREAQLRREFDAEDVPVRSGYGLYGRPTKPATSGRKRRAA